MSTATGSCQLPELRADLLGPDPWCLVDEHERVWELTELDPALATALNRCTGHVTEQTLRALIPRRLWPEWSNLLEQLADLDLLASHTRAPTIAVVGSGRLARAVARAICLTGPVHLTLLDPTPPSSVLYPGSRFPSGAGALQQWLRPVISDDQQVVLGSHWAEVQPGHYDVVVVAPDTAAIDRGIIDHLTRHQITHLLVSQHRNQATVGPLVTPTGPCQLCLDLARADQHRHWPDQIAQLAQRPARPSQVMIEWAATTAALMVHRGQAVAEVHTARVGHSPQRHEVEAHAECLSAHAKLRSQAEPSVHAKLRAHAEHRREHG